MLVFNCIRGNAARYLSDSIDMTSHMHDRNTRLNMSSDVNVYHWVERITCADRLYIEVQQSGMHFQMILMTRDYCLLSKLI